LLIVVSVLTVVAIMGVSFIFSMFLETQASRHFSATAQARYLAEAGVSYAWALLDEDRLGSRIDDLTEAWVDQMVGDDVDVDGDETADARWWLLENAATRLVGRYAVLISDEAGKVNLNAALADPSGQGLGAVDLTALLSQQGIPNASQLAQAIEDYRDGPDARPGVAQVDDDRDGAVDEPDEYQALALRGDDRKFENLEEILSLGSLDAEALARLATVATVYSWDPNADLSGQPRLNLNTATADELLAVLLETGGDNPWQMAANMADAVDPDVAISYVNKIAARFTIPNQGDQGDWRWQSEPVGHYTTDVANAQPLSWQVTVPTGTFQVLVHGVSGFKVGDVDLQGQTKPSMDSGDAFGTLEISGPLSVRITCRQPAGTRCTFQGLELVASEATAGFSTVPVRGIEAIRINELMVAPTIELTATEASFNPQTSGWTCPAGSGFCSNSGTGQARWSWTSSTVRPGQYYVRVYGTQAGQTVGEVRLGGQTATLVHGQRHPDTLAVGSDQTITVVIGKTPSSGTYYVQKVALSLEPDAEYVELINLSDEEIDVSGWILEGDATAGRQARVPEGSLVKAHGLLALAVDAVDTQAGLAGNRIDASSAWEMSANASLAQLEFPGGELTPDADWLSTKLPTGTSARLVLRAGEWVADEVEYAIPLPAVAPFQSLEKGDPSVVTDADADGVDDGWYPSLKLYTPGAGNDNDGLREFEGVQQIVHDPSTEVTVRNRPLDSVGELAGVPSGTAWHAASASDLARFVDRLTVEGLLLETEGHGVEGEGSWRESVDGYEANTQGAQGTWQWTDIPDGQYRVSLYGWSGEQLSVRWQLADESFSEWIPTRSTDAQGRIIVGQVTVGMDVSAPNTLVLQARCDSPSGVCHLNHIRLDPRLGLTGMVNINTASLEVLLSLPGMTQTIAERLIQHRPYGDQEEKARGIGDLLMGSVLGDTDEDRLSRFRQLAHLITVRSQVFRIMSVGETLEREKPVASQRIQAVVQR
jgi:type II secretory pathway component PulK